MANRVDAQALCRCLYELTDGDPSAAPDMEWVGVHLAFSQQETRRAAGHAERRGWLAINGARLCLTQEGRRMAQQPWRQRFRIWGKSGTPTGRSIGKSTVPTVA